MFVPSDYQVDNAAWRAEIIRQNPLALMVTSAEPVPWATHLPVIVPPGAEFPARATNGADPFVGSTLLGHLNRANPHFAALSTGTHSILVFGGPHGYVSPTVYGTTPAAPTWNFTAVHVHGTVRMIDDAEQTLDVVRATVATYEGTFGTNWDATGSLDYFRRILPGVGAFEFRIDRVDAMFKLSQDQKPETRRRVTRSFAGSAVSSHRQLAKLMDRLDQDGTPQEATVPVGEAAE
ncbi:FMN-binding negative transcriptional regulator [Micromonospora sp. C31]|uniref:FMN-binding negative transcriptional regulator n=1 Tax=Micromonospora sp. C31 TaxID=2824876 RepID=UPI001B3769CF|nr:FMN-binding negative transcriptional regulator [Micromonospora sp. C31]MBQ1075632.1 FMN-binding negative transcriptional regulator [Micromonospora sp. C31]